jgi:hypothetical protein
MGKGNEQTCRHAAARSLSLDTAPDTSAASYGNRILLINKGIT